MGQGQFQQVASYDRPLEWIFSRFSALKILERLQVLSTAPPIRGFRPGRGGGFGLPCVGKLVMLSLEMAERKSRRPVILCIGLLYLWSHPLSTVVLKISSKRGAVCAFLYSLNHSRILQISVLCGESSR